MSVGCRWEATLVQISPKANRILDESDIVEGWVDGYHRGEISGWAWRPAAPERPVALEILVDGQLVAETVAQLPRVDLAQAGKSGGAHGFAVRLSLDAADMRTVEVAVRAKGGAPLPNGEFPLDPAARAAAPSGTAIAPPVRWDEAAGIIGCLDRFGPDRIVGWVCRPAKPSEPIRFELREGGERVGLVTAGIWRTDIEELHQGDGRWGFDAPFPGRLVDGQSHLVELRLADGGPAMLKAPVAVCYSAREHEPEASQPDDFVESMAARSRPLRRAAPAEPLVTFVVNFYNMRREAERTLTSLTRSYQRGIGDLRYEVICIDNGSDPPLDAEWVRSFGPEFRLIRPANPLPSPCRAINEAASEAKGRYLAIMIDGAHVLTPGVLREVWDAVEEAPDAVVALRQWFVGGDQRWLSSIGYGTAQEDMLFDKIAWPKDGYELFRIGTPVWESANHWFSGIIESNCLFLPRTTYQQIGGMNEAFSEPGAGYANLDLFKRAALAVEEPVVALLGEASFHQFHGGTTTNVSDEEKDRRVRAYENNYAQIRGQGFSGVKEFDIRLRGQHRAFAGVAARQRPLSPARIGLTDRVRPGTQPLHLGEMATDYLRSTYVECGLNRTTRWFGHELSLAPPDVLAIQEIIHEQRPDRIVTVNAEPGIIHLAASVLDSVGLARSRVLRVADAPAEAVRPDRVEAITGDMRAGETLAAVARALGSAERVVVLFAPGAGDHFPIEALRASARFVSPRSYLVFLGSVFGQPWLGYSKNWFAKAIRILVDELPFAIDETRTRHLITTCPRGYLQRIGDFPPTADATGG